MNDQFRPETISSPEKSAKELYAELSKINNEAMQLIAHINALGEKASADGLSKEVFASIAAERADLLAQFKKKWEAENKLEEQLVKIEAAGISKLEEKLRASEA